MFTVGTANLAVTKTATTDRVFSDGVYGYTITVTNEGALDVIGAVVMDDFPSLLTDVHWTCTASPGSRCTPSGTGTVNHDPHFG